MEAIAGQAMNGRRYGLYLLDDDPVIGNRLYSLIRSLTADLAISSTHNPISNGLSERTGRELKELLQKQDLGIHSLSRTGNISPALQYSLARAARNAKIRKVLGNFSPAVIENLDFDQ